MKFALKKYIPIILLGITLLVATIYLDGLIRANLNKVEGLQGNTLNSLENLPTWFVYLILLMILFIILAQVLYPWFVAATAVNKGFSTANHWINSAYATPRPTPTRSSSS